MRIQPSAFFLAVAAALGAPGLLATEPFGRAVVAQQEAAVPAAVPGAPVLSHTVIGNTVSLTWSPAASGGVATGYMVEASFSAGGPAAVVFQVAATTLTVPNVPAGTYFVRIRATNAEGSGPPSNEETVVVGAPCATPPGAPGTLTASPPGPSVTLSWSPPAGGCPATHFALHAGFAPGQVLFNVPVGANTSFSGTAAPGRYFVSVVAVNAAGEGPPSNEVEVVIACVAPGPPVGLNATVNGRTVTLRWSPPASGGAAAGYMLEAGSASGATDVGIPVATTSFSTVAPDGTYFVRVRGTNACGVSPPSNEVTVVVPNCGPPPGAPSTPTATVTGGTASISWGAVAGATSYQLEVGTSSGASNTAVQTVTGTSQQLSLSAGNYFMRVRALNACGSAGPPSGEGTFTIVNAPILMSISVTGPASLAVGQSGQFTATAAFSDGSTANVTATAAWASSNTSVATPVSPGTINALAQGTTNITATREGTTGSIAVQVVNPTASFVVTPEQGTIPPGLSGDCRVRRRAPGEPNELRCTFDGRASSPDNAAYEWEIPIGRAPFTAGDVVEGTMLALPCGTFGEPDNGLDAEAVEADVRLRVTIGGTSVTQTRTLTFIKLGAC